MNSTGHGVHVRNSARGSGPLAWLACVMLATGLAWAGDAHAQPFWRGERHPQALQDDRRVPPGARGDFRPDLRRGEPRGEARRLTPEERQQIRRDVTDAERDFYRDRPLRRR